MERESFGNLLLFGNVMIFPGEELSYPENFMATFEFHCVLTFLRKLFGNDHRPSLFSIFDKVMWRGRMKTRNAIGVFDDYFGPPM
jgi:hypothetical protein